VYHPTNEGLLTRAQVGEILTRFADAFMNDTDAAKALGISTGTLSVAVRGQSKIGPVLLEFLGLERVDRYRVNRLTCGLEQAMQDHLIPRSVEYDDARRSAERSAEDGEGGWLAKSVREGEGHVDAELEPEHPRAAALAARISRRHRVRKGRDLPAEGPRSAAGDLGRSRKRLSLAQIGAMIEAGHAFTDRERSSAYQTLRMLTHLNTKASQETRQEALRLYQALAGKKPVHAPRRIAKRPEDITPLAIRRARARLTREIEDTGLVVVTADTPALLAAADELVLDGLAQAISDRIERVRGGPVAAGASTRRERRVLKITGDQRI